LVIEEIECFQAVFQSQPFPNHEALE
jgi:hypothetical protein